MAHIILELKPSEKALEKEILSDDVISRQSITIRDGKVLGLAEDKEYILIEGSEEAIERVKGIAPNNILSGKWAAEAYEKLKSEEEDAASGMGFIFQ
ncbi:MAG TPA: hypothetical protein ENF69_05455 [Euryarchaeota archaeon]|nr:MAG: hypothetical protein DRN28_00645 [Thermoplasmata archaeon]RLF67839.1 MAG: hypothetical protein DRN40_08165 [Thermoplasmata archaeon]HDD60374.1 hypothetical protein [Euryarchaeota archaeon]